VLESPRLSDDYNSLFNLLRRSPYLELLYISDIRFPNDDNSSIPTPNEVPSVNLPSFKRFQIYDAAGPVSVLLKALPIPSRSMTIEIRDDGRNSLISLPGVGIAEATIIQHLTTFWSQTTTETSLPGGTLTLNQRTISADLDHVLEFRSPKPRPQLLFRARCIVQGHDSALESVETLRVCGARNTSWESCVSQLPGIRHIF
jgi:hypothetical protein